MVGEDWSMRKIFQVPELHTCPSPRKRQASYSRANGGQDAVTAQSMGQKKAI